MNCLECRAELPPQLPGRLRLYCDDTCRCRAFRRRRGYGTRRLERLTDEQLASLPQRELVALGVRL